MRSHERGALNNAQKERTWLNDHERAKNYRYRLKPHAWKRYGLAGSSDCHPHRAYRPADRASEDSRQGQSQPSGTAEDGRQTPQPAWLSG